jgi:hypothetical protein
MGGLKMDWDKLIKDAISIWDKLADFINKEAVNK